MSLERNIESVITNFKRLYDEADAARLTVINKLKQIEEREKKLRKEQIEFEKKQNIILKNLNTNNSNIQTGTNIQNIFQNF